MERGVKPTLAAASDEAQELARELVDAVIAGVDDVRVWLDSPRGRRYRALAARGLVLAAPAIMKHPFFKTPVGRLVGLAGGSALVVKLADQIRDRDLAPPLRATR